MNASIHLHGDEPVTAQVLPLDDGRQFIELRLGGGLLTIYLVGFDAQSQASARAIAASLVEAADQMGTFPPADAVEHAS